MSAVRKWTPIQEARFHFRNKPAPMSVRNWVRHLWPGMEPQRIRAEIVRIKNLIAMAQAEEDAA